MWVSFFDYLLILIGILLSVAFFTLTERSILSYMQLRSGPNKVFYYGLMQAMVDGGKLFMKDYFFLSLSSSMFFFMGPVIGMFVSMFCWFFIPNFYFFESVVYSLVFVFCVLSLGVYSLMFCGWGSNSKYSVLGVTRSISQTISYEVMMMLYLMIMVFYFFSYDLWKFNVYWWMLFCYILIFLVWMSVVLAEVNRSPYDFSEGESELVSGFNTEYGSVGFSLIFIAEYSSIMMMSGLTSIMFFSGGFIMIKLMFFSIFVVWCRASYPRMRYDKLMSISWGSFLPLGLCLFIIFGQILF